MERLWIFDFDGTLSLIVPDRRDAVMEESCRQLLAGLSADNSQLVAVISSRTLDDLIPRIGMAGISLGGNNGLEWIYSDSKRRSCYGEVFEKDVMSARATLLPKLLTLRDIPGLDIEDKHWSVTIHFREVSVSKKKHVVDFAREWTRLSGTALLEGQEACEILFAPLADKSLGVLILCKHMCPRQDRQIIYAGDDNNDLRAMKTVLAMEGAVITVGRLRLPGNSRHADSPRELVQICRDILAGDNN